MAAFRDVTEITAWQLAHQLNLRVDLFLLSPEFRRHYKHSDRLSDVVRAAPRNIAEGFAGDRDAFAERLRIAKGSQTEVLGHLADAYDQCLITLDEWQIAERLTKRAIKAANGLIRSLESTGEIRAEMRATRRSRPPRRRGPTSLD